MINDLINQKIKAKKDYGLTELDSSITKYSTYSNESNPEFDGYYVAADLNNDVDLDRIFDFSVPLHARDPRDVAIAIEEQIVFYLKNKYYDQIMILTGASDNILNIDELEINDFRTHYNYAKLNYSEALGMYSYLITTFGKERFFIKDNGILTLKVSYDEYTTKVKDQLDNIDFSLRLDSYIINLLYNIRLKYEKKVALDDQKVFNSNYNARYSKNSIEPEFDETQYLDPAECTSEMYIDDNDELGGASIKESKKDILLSYNKYKMAKLLIKKNIAYNNIDSILTKIGFTPEKKQSILNEVQSHYTKGAIKDTFSDIISVSKEINVKDYLEF